MNAAQKAKHDLDIEKRDDDRAKETRAETEKNRNALANIEKEEYGDGTKPSLHQVREDAGKALVKARDKDAPDAEAEAKAIASLNQTTQRLRLIMRRKRDLGAISQQQYAEYMANLLPYRPGGAKNTTGTPATKPPLKDLWR